MNFQSLSKPANQRILALVAAGTALSVAITVYGMSQVNQPQPSTGEVVETNVPTVRQVTALGRLEPATEVIRVSVPAILSNDRVAQLLVRRGDRVEADQVIAIMGSSNRLEDALLQAQAQVKIAQAELARVRAGAKSGEIIAQEAEITRLEKELESEIIAQQATIVRWQSEVNVAEAEYNRYASLYRDGATSASELDQRRLVLETTQAQLNEAEAGQSQRLETLREQIRQARANLDRIAEVRPVDVQAAQAEVERAIAAANEAETNLDEASIRAPVTGQILDIVTNPGEVVGEDGILDLGQTEQMQVVAEVYQTDIGKVRPGQEAIITSESFPEQLQGTVELVGLQVLQQSVTSGQAGENLDRRVVEVRIRLNSEDSQQVAHLTNLQVQVAIPTD
ncbi:MAG: HlyD family efflux transporter periplasmic adaptor subunit [Leptolyngbyaceae cyanobacterium SM1_4_3]|nr:HlyD family efflux transporter periplasmic adaptor subunit [Leptolyngbyaceae cyanobacterium SM1_4_3]